MTRQEADSVTVSDYISTLNDGLTQFGGRVRGEITELQLYPGRSYIFFSLKDKEENAVLRCFMWKRDYSLCGVELEIGLEIIASGFPEVYAANGGLTFKSRTIEYVGEGKLKKAYDELKAKLEKEGVFSADRKRLIPDLPTKIGLITSRDGAAIDDFKMNLGKFGYHVAFVNSRVEGQLAVGELLGALRSLKTKDIEVLVMVRGGGSLESLLPFNNETLVREIAAFPVPVLVGVGHERDISLVALAADVAVSTPTATAHTLNQSWHIAVHGIDAGQRTIFSRFKEAVSEHKEVVESGFQLMRSQLQSIFDDFDTAEKALMQVVTATRARVGELERRVREYPSVFERGMRLGIRGTKETLSRSLSGALSDLQHGIAAIKQGIDFEQTSERFGAALKASMQSVSSADRILSANNPERQLKLGYSIVTSGGKLLRDVAGLQKGQTIDVRVRDGAFSAEINDIKKGV